MSSKPFSQACENNKLPILNVIQSVFSNASKVLEVGSGTGQHAVFFAQQMPHLFWQTADMQENHQSIEQWLAEAQLANLGDPLSLDLLNDVDITHLLAMNQRDGAVAIDGIFSANTCHIMNFQAVENLFNMVGKLLKNNNYFCLYGPFKHRGEYTSDSNHQFDQWLQRRDPESGIRDIDDLRDLAKNAGLALQQHHYLPANNEILVWQVITK